MTTPGINPTRSIHPQAMFALLIFTMRQVIFQKKIWFTLFLLIVPAGMTLLVDSVSPAQSSHEQWELYHIPVNFFFFMMIVPLICMLHGSSLIGADAENGTLAYLLTRTLRRSTVLIVKFAANVSIISVLAWSALLLQYAVALGGVDIQAFGTQGIAWQPFDELLTYMSVVPFAIAAYLSVFILIGLVTARTLIASILYMVIVEMFLANLPIGIRIYSVAHQIRTAFFKKIPELNILYENVTEMVDESFRASYAGIMTLSSIVVVALLVGCLLMSTRELIAAKVSSD